LLAGEALRLLPFFALLPAYYFFHLAKIPPSTFSNSGLYRSGVNWPAILGNARKLSLWIVRIYALTGDKFSDRMYQSNPLNNTIGISMLLLTAAQWTRKARRDPHLQLVLLLMLAWVATFLVMPVYAGGFLWHTNLPVVGYSVLFGMAAVWWLETLPRMWLRYAVSVAALLAFLLLGRQNLKAELYNGSHEMGFRLNHSVIDHPPVPVSRLGPAPLVYIEDRKDIGPWWYGTYGRLFNFAYLRHDIEEVIVPEMRRVPQGLRDRWLAHKNAFFFVYDADYNWHDASEEFRKFSVQRGSIEPATPCLAAGQSVQFRLVSSGGTGSPEPVWSIDPPGAGSIDSRGTYRAPVATTGPDSIRVTAGVRGQPNPLAITSVNFVRSLPIRINAGGQPLTDPAGKTWEGDRFYSGGDTYTTGNAIGGTDSPALYQSERFNAGPLEYSLCVADGTYTVRLKFAEIWYTQPGQRIFDISINGASVLRHFDIVAAAGGPNRALDREFRVPTVDHRIVIQLKPVVSNPKISAIELVPR
jgi:hypothetical protein